MSYTLQQICYGNNLHMNNLRITECLNTEYTEEKMFVVVVNPTKDIKRDITAASRWVTIKHYFEIIKALTKITEFYF